MGSGDAISFRAAADQAIEELGPYFGVPDVDALRNRLELLSEPIPEGEKTYSPPGVIDQIISDIISRKGISVVEILNRITDLSKSAPADQLNALSNAFSITYDYGSAWDIGSLDGAGVNVYGKGQDGPGQKGFYLAGLSGEGCQIRDMLPHIPDGLSDYINAKPAAPTDLSPALAVIQIFDPSKTIITRDTGRAQLFFNAIPAIELNRCTPYFDLTIVGAEAPITPTGEIAGMNLSRTLLGNIKVPGFTDAENFDGALASIVTARDVRALEMLGVSALDMNKAGFRATAGMELFTMPQTMVPVGRPGHPTQFSDSFGMDLSGGVMGGVEDLGDSLGGSERGDNILDPFKPVASIESFSSTTNDQFKTGFERANLTMVVHDRSRLHEVAPLCKADYVGSGKMSIIIEYGWSHPDGHLGSTNSYGKFLNGMRRISLFKVQQSSLNMGKDGQVRIDLKLAAVGASSLDHIMISSSETSAPATDVIDELTRSVNELLKRVFQGNRQQLRKAKQWGTLQTLKSANSTDGALNMNPKVLAACQKYIKANKDNENPDIEALADILGKLLGEDGEDGATQEYKSKTVAEVLRKKFESIKKLPDPFLKELKDGTKNNTFINPPVRTGGLLEFSSPDYISLGKLMIIFVGEPIASSKRFAEIQFIFYSLNSNATFVKDFNLAQFPIHIGEFTAWYAKQIELSGNDMEIGTFMHFIKEKFVSAYYARPYGFIKDFGKKSNGYNVKKRARKGGVKSNTPNRVLRAAYGGKGNKFKKPALKYLLESIPLRPPPTTLSEGVARGGGDASRILLRIHVYDSAEPKNPTLEELLRAADSDSGMGVIRQVAGKAKAEPAGADIHKPNYVKTVKAALKAGLIRPRGNTIANPAKPTDEEILESRFDVIGGFQAIKNFVTLGMPTIKYGSNASTITAASVQPIAVATLEKVLTQKALKGGLHTPPGKAQGDLPMRVSPVRLSLTSFGNPLVEFGQEYFVDMQTNTNIDNIYKIAGNVKHSMSRGKFETSIDMTNMGIFEGYVAPMQDLQDALDLMEKEGKGT